MKLNIARFLERSQTEGPGWRAVIWVQGCPILCKGCINQEMLPFVDKQWIEVEDLAKRILAIQDIEGLTFLGGEPFSQAEALAELAQRVRQAGLSIMTFSGFTLEELEAQDKPSVQALIKATDLLVDGQFIQSQATTDLPWVGSKNQRYHFLSERYRHLENRLSQSYSNGIEFRLTGNMVQMNGLFDQKLFKQIKQALANPDLPEDKGDSSLDG